jgi:hypothetical protein
MAKAHQHHHTVPASYLRSFATRKRREKQPRVEVLDLGAGEWRRQRPVEICKQRSFYSVDLEGFDEQSIELEVLKRLEDDAAPLFRRLDREASQRPLRPPVVEEADFDLLAAFVAMAFTRTDRARRGLLHAGLALARELADQTAPDPDEFERQKAEMRRDGIEIDLSFEDYRGFLDRGEVTLHQNVAVMVMLSAWQDLYGSIRRRNLSLLVADGSAGLLATSDDPVSVYKHAPTPGDDEAYLFDPRALRYGIVMPISPHLLVRFDANRPPDVRFLEPEEVASANTTVAMPQRRYVFSNTQRFPWWDGAGIVWDAAALREEANRCTAEADQTATVYRETRARELLEGSSHEE